MPTFNEHIANAGHNLHILEDVHNKVNDSWDWQVTIVFYTALHLINAQIAQKCNLHYRNHGDVDHAINPFNKMSLATLPEDQYLAYQKLHNLSRRARYLINDNPKNHDPACHFTYDKHFAKAIKYLDNLIEYFSVKYSISLPEIEVGCLDLNKAILTRIKKKI